MVSKSVIFLGSKPVGYECFRYLISQKEKLNITIAGLLTQARKEFGSGHDLAQLARENNIPIFNELADLPECDILYSVQYHKILKPADISKARQIAVNLHMAPLPEYRGSNQFSFALIDQKKEFGTTIHAIDSRIDHGAILFQTRFPIPEKCWVNNLYQLTFDASFALFQNSLEDIVNGNYTPLPQIQLEAQHGTHLHFRNEMDALKVIELSWDKEKIERYIRATSMPGFEPPYFLLDGEKIHFSKES